MTWTRERPTQAGYYWVRSAPDWKARMMRVSFDWRGELSPDENNAREPASFPEGAKYWGPIVPPVPEYDR